MKMNKGDMNIIAHLPYIKVKRTIEDNVQNHKEEEYIIELSSYGIQTAYDTFLLEEVLDISYRDFSQHLGLLYLHTIKGLYPYTVKTNPQSFIREFKKIKQI